MKSSLCLALVLAAGEVTDVCVLHHAAREREREKRNRMERILEIPVSEQITNNLCGGASISP